MLDNPAIRIAFAVGLSAIFFAFVLTLLPETPLPTEAQDSLSWLFDSLWAWDFMIPFSTLVYAFSLVFGLEVLFITLKIVFWLKKHLTQQH